MNIKVSRYEGASPWAASIEPEDRSWVLFVPADSTQPPQLWLRAPSVDGDDTYRPA